MDGVDPNTLLEWLQTGVGEERDLQMMALEQLCMLLLMSDNIDRCFESCPPRTFLPTLCKIFLDDTATENVLEVTARAITYYLDVSNECTRRITQVEGAVKAICNRLAAAEMTNRTSKDLAEQCVKLLEHICQRETSAVYDAGGLQCMLALVRQHGQSVHKDTVHSAMSVVTRLCSKMEPNDSAMPQCSADLGALVEHDDPKVSECALRCFAALTDRFIRKSMDPVELARHGNLVDHLLNSLVPVTSHHLLSVHSAPSLAPLASISGIPNAASSASLMLGDSTAVASVPTPQKSSSFTSIVISVLSNLCRGSEAVTEQVVSSTLLIPALKTVLSSKDERCVMDAMRFCDLLLILLCEGRHALPRSSTCSSVASRSETSTPSAFERSHRHLIDCIRQRDTDALIDAVESGQVDANFMDDVGQTLLNWASAFGTIDMVTYLCDKGADVNKGQRSSSLHYAACFGRPDVVKVLLKNGANPELRDEEGKTALDKARERSEEGHQQVSAILESPSSYMQKDETEKIKRDKLDDPKQIPVDPATVRNLLEQLLPILCDEFQRTMGTAILKSSVSLIRKTVHHMSPESLNMLVNTNFSTGTEAVAPFVSGQKLAEGIVNVIVMMLEHEDNIEGQENVLLLMRSLFEKDVDFWLEQLMRVGVFDKVEAIASEAQTAAVVTTVPTLVKEMDLKVSASDIQVSADAAKDSFTVHKDDTASSNEKEKSPCFDEKLESPVSSSVNSVPEVAEVRSDGGSTPSAVTEPDETERNQMLNLPPQTGAEAGLSVTSLDSGTTPPPTVEAPMDTTLKTDNESVKRGKAGIVRTGAQRRRKSGAVATAFKSSSNEDVWEVVQEKHYRWKDWRIIKTRDSFYIWCDAVAMELSDASNGWFRFMLDGQLSTMYSSGSPETGADNAEKRGEFLDKLTKARNAVPPGSPLLSVLSQPNDEKSLHIGNWILKSSKVGELSISNRDGNQQRMIITEDMPGFVFETNRQTRHCFQAESTLGLDFVTGWAARGDGRRLRFRTEARKAKLQEMAKDLWEKYIKEAQAKPRDALIELQKTAASMKAICESTGIGELESDETRKELVKSLKYLRESVVNDCLLSTFELSISGIVGALLSLLRIVSTKKDCSIGELFLEHFSDSRSLGALVRKVVLILETVEKFPQYLYDTPGGSSYGLQLLSRKIKLKLELNQPTQKSINQNQFLDRTGRLMKTEPLTTVGQLKSFILKMVSKQWYDHERESFNFVKQIKEAKKTGDRLNFVYTSDFDDRGIIYWLGTNGKTSSEWTNPASVQVIHATSSDGSRQPYGKPEDIFSRDVNAVNCHTSDDKNAHFTMDLGISIYPTMYSLRHARGYGRSALRNWLLQGSRNGRSWDTLVTHENDTSLNDVGSTASWPISCPKGKGPYRYLRIMQNGKNASNQTCYLSLSGFEVYGTVVDVVINDFKPLDEKVVGARGRSKKSTSSGSKENKAASNTPATSVAAGDEKESSGSMKEIGITYLPSGPNNNKLACGFLGAEVLSPTLKNKVCRMFRYRRGLRHGNSTAAKGPPAVSGDGDSLCSIGSRVTRGPDWRWGTQDGGTDGTVISHVENGSAKTHGWVDVQWDSSIANSYRYGFDGKFDIAIKSSAPHPAAVVPVPPLRRVGRGFPGNRRDVNPLSNVPIGLPFSFTPLPSRQLPPTPRAAFESNIVHRQANRGVVHSLPFAKFYQQASNARAYNTSVVDSSRGSVSTANSSEASSSRESKAKSSASSTISQKSMSTTNLSDGSEAEKRPSVASTNQAASAESLQHQTPSLENLLARSRIYDEKIPEVVNDDGSGSGIETVAADVDSESVSTGNVGYLDSSADSIDTQSLFTEADEGSETSGVRSTVGGSQPVLHEIEGSVDACATSSSSVTDGPQTPKKEDSYTSNDKASEIIPASVEETNAKNLVNLSVSAPDLVVMRQQRAQTTAGDSETISSHPREESVDSSVDGIPNAVLGTAPDDVVQVYLMSDGRSEESLAAAVEAMARHSSIASASNGVGVDCAPSGDTEDSISLSGEVETIRGILRAYTESRSTEEGGSNVLDESTTSGDATPTESTTTDTTEAISANSENSSRHSRTENPRLHFEGYTDVFRSMMQQILDSGGGALSALDFEEIEDEMYDEDMQDDGNEDDCDDDYPRGLSVEALAHVTAALKRQSSSGSTESNSDLKLSFKQILMGEAGHLLSEHSLRIVNNERQRRNAGGLFRSWDDDFVLKQQFPALIPAFDPRPGRPNVNQTQDIELPVAYNDEISVESNGKSRGKSDILRSIETTNDFIEPKLRLYVRGPNLANIANVTVELDNDKASFFSFLQQLVQNVDWGQKSERTRRIWEPTYTLVYEELFDGDEIVGEQSTVRKSSQMSPAIVNEVSVVKEATLALLSILHKLGNMLGDFEMTSETFISEKLTQKLMQELADPLVVAACALPAWCDLLVYHHPCLFSVETRTYFLQATAFGTARAIVWLQARRDQILKQTRGASSAAAVSNLASARRDDHYPEYRVGRIKHERIKVPRNDDQLLDYASRVMKFHAPRKAVLEIEYQGEEGTGLGPTLEFYALVAAEFQKKSLAMWICDDSDEDQLKREEFAVDLGEGVKPPGYYVRRAGGLFPAALPPLSEDNKRAVEFFRILGIFLAKVIQDGRLVDLPLARPFLKLLVNTGVVDIGTQDLRNILTLDDFEEVSPMNGRILRELSLLVGRKRAIESDLSVDPEVKRRRIDRLTLNVNGTEYSVEDLSLSFVVNPPSSVFTYSEMELVEGGSNMDVTTDNMDLYVEKCTDFYLNTGIRNQITALREGFDTVFPLKALRMFAPEEVQTLLSGEQYPEWTRDDIMNYTEPKLGYTKDSPGFLRFVDVLVGMTPSERKSFLQFTTGCSSLPPGGLANLHPRLTVVRKVDSGDGSYPSVNTCVHYLKLPDYSSTEIMRERLLTATAEKGFHLN